jgi:hypothetical protein
LKGLVGAWGFEPRPPPCQVVLDGGPTLLESITTKFPKKVRTACAASTASTARSAHFCVPNCVPTLYHRSNEQDDSPERCGFLIQEFTHETFATALWSDSIQIRTHRPSCCFSSSSQLKTMTIFVRSPSGLVADWSIKSRPSGYAS